MKNITEKIITKVISGDVSAIEFFVYEMNPVVYYMTYKSFYDAYTAEDCAQEILVRLVKKLSTYDSRKSNFNTWAYTLIKHTIMNYSDKINRSKEITEANEEYIMGLAEDRTNYLNCSDELTKLESYIGEDDYRLLYFRLGLNYKYKEIAKLFDLPETTVKRKINEALKKVKKYKERGKNEK